jgi:hypothetical protein
MASRGQGEEWVELGRRPWWVSLVGYSPFLTVLPVLTINVGGIVWPELPIGWSIAVMLALMVVSFAVVVVVLRLMNPNAFVNPLTSTVRTGRKQVHYSEITSAQIFPSMSKSHRSLLLLLRADKKLRASILLRDTNQRTLAPELTALLLDLVDQSTIAMPVSPDDPKGRFARFNFPNNITKEETAELVAHPPASADKLPIPYL